MIINKGDENKESTLNDDKSSSKPNKSGHDASGTTGVNVGNHDKT